MDSSPLPPHERTWRHPSEVGPTTVDVDRGSQHRIAALATGAVAVALVAALVITVTPRASLDSPIAVSATTTPGARESIRSAANSAVTAAESLRSVRLSDARAIPSAIADIPADAFRSATAVAPQVVLPDLDDRVLVLTEQYAYPVDWRDVARLDVEGDATVVGIDGSIVARFDDGRLIVSHDLLVGSALAVD